MKKCCACGRQHERLAKKCLVCVRREVDRQKRKYQERLANGLCPRCGHPPIDGKKHCGKCAARVREKGRKVRASRSAKGICVYCGHNRSVDGLRTCTKCLTRLGDSHKNRVDKLNSSGMCVRCGRFPQLHGRTRANKPHTTCQTCYLKHISSSNLGTREHANALLVKIESQNYKCPYTGEKLVLGNNAWVDHIMPRSRFPELANDIDNVEWVTETVNRMKQNRTPDEFLALVKKIYHYRCD